MSSFTSAMTRSWSAVSRKGKAASKGSIHPGSMSKAIPGHAARRACVSSREAARVDHGAFGGGLLARPALSPKRMQAHAARPAQADVAAEQMHLAHGDVQFRAIGVFDGEDFGTLPADLDFGGSKKPPHAVVHVHDEVAGGEIRGRVEPPAQRRDGRRDGAVSGAFPHRIQVGTAPGRRAASTGAGSPPDSTPRDEVSPAYPRPVRGRAIRASPRCPGTRGPLRPSAACPASCARRRRRARSVTSGWDASSPRSPSPGGGTTSRSIDSVRGGGGSPQK
jgi:hypothetical protein